LDNLFSNSVSNLTLGSIFKVDDAKKFKKLRISWAIWKMGLYDYVYIVSLSWQK